MNMKRLLCICNCGGFGQPFSIWMTDQKALCVTAHCISCESQFSVLFPLADLFKDCPLPDLKALDAAIGAEIAEIAESADPKPIKLTQLDKRWLKELKIQFTAP